MTQQPLTMQIYCRVTVNVDDPAAVVSQAVQELAAANIDWAAEEDDLETATEELRGDLNSCLGSLVDPYRLLDGIPGVTARSGQVWAEQGDPDPRFHPSFGGVR